METPLQTTPVPGQVRHAVRSAFGTVPTSHLVQSEPSSLTCPAGQSWQPRTPSVPVTGLVPAEQVPQAVLPMIATSLDPQAVQALTPAELAKEFPSHTVHSSAPAAENVPGLHWRQVDWPSLGW